MILCLRRLAVRMFCVYPLQPLDGDKQPLMFTLSPRLRQWTLRCFNASSEVSSQVWSEWAHRGALLLLTWKCTAVPVVYARSHVKCVTVWFDSWLLFLYKAQHINCKPTQPNLMICWQEVEWKKKYMFVDKVTNNEQLLCFHSIVKSIYIQIKNGSTCNCTTTYLQQYRAVSPVTQNFHSVPF